MNPFSIHLASANDIPSLLRFMERFYAIDGYPFDAARAQRALTQFFAEPSHGSIFLIDVNGETVGYIVLAVVYSFEFGGKNAFVDEFYLEPEHRGKGLGRAVMERIGKVAAERGITALHLEVEHHNARALALYHSFGFQDHHRVLMTKMLS